MNKVSASYSLKSKFQRLSALLQAGVLALAGIVPLLTHSPVSAAQLTARSATINNSVVSATDVEFAFGYTLINTAATKAGIMYQFCTTPLGTCVLPTGMDVQTSNSHDSQAAWPTNGTPFAPVSEAANVGDCTLNTNAYVICYSRDEAVATGVTGGAVTHTISGIVAPSAVQSVYIRVSIYSDDDFGAGDVLDTGTVAVAFVDQLTINGRVQERLNFCVAAVDDGDAMPGTVAICTALSDANVDLGIIDETAPSKTPVNTASTGADDDYGILMLNTNANGGAVVGYFPVADAGGTNETFSFRVDNATCVASGSQPDSTDQCFIDAANSGAGTTLAAAGEGFGVHVTCIETPGTTAELEGSVPGWYNGADNDTSDAGGTGSGDSNCDSTDAGLAFGWNESGVSDTLASSSDPVDNEIIKLAFGASAAITTPSGNYTAVTTYIATVTF